MRSMLRSAVFSILLLVFLFQSQFTAVAAESNNPLILPNEIIEYTELPDKVINILLLGIDFGTNGYWGSGKKTTIENCHTDAVMVIAINLDQTRIDLLSLPRDTLTYVPGIKGIYKLNAAVNCAETLEEGLQRTKSAVEWLLGDIRVDYYFAVDMNTMIVLGDAIGGVDFEMEMNYVGESGTKYHKGMQHLDGIGITDYLRARTKATVNYTDIGRTNRQRRMMRTIFEKLKSDEDMIWNLFATAITLYDGFFTDITTAVIVQLATILPTVLSVDAETIGTHVFEGPYRTSNSWNFTFTDQEHRLSVIEEVYGVTAEPIPYVSYNYTQWLDDEAGFSAVHYISVAQQLMTYSNDIGVDNLTDEQREAYDTFNIAYQEAVSAFNLAANSMLYSDTRVLSSTRVALRDAAEICATALNYAGDLRWLHSREYWYNDPYINEYQLDWR